MLPHVFDCFLARLLVEFGVGDVLSDALGPGVGHNHAIQVELPRKMATVLLVDLAQCSAGAVVGVVLQVDA